MSTLTHEPPAYTGAVPEITTADQMRHTQRDLTPAPPRPPVLGENVCCPRCNGAIDPMHRTMQPTRSAKHYESSIYCDFCEIGFESLWVFRPGPFGGFWDIDLTIRHEREQLDAFRRKLEILTCA